MMQVENQKKNATYINKLNKIQVLKLIREYGEISRADIVKMTQLSAPTVTRIVDSLIHEKLAQMVGLGDSTGGRPPKLIRFDGRHNYVIGIDLGSTSIRGVLSNLDGKFITEIEMPTNLPGGFQIIIKQVASIIQKLIQRSKTPEDKILGVGMAVAGLINPKTGVIEFSPVFNWENVNLATALSKHINLPIIYDNVARVTALGESVYGIGKKHKNFICVNVGYGIGAGIITDGSLFYGNQGFAGEFGYIVLEKDSPYVGKSGIRGCLEATSSGYSIVEIAKSYLQQGKPSTITDQVDSLDSLTAKVVFDAAKGGDSLAETIVDDALANLGRGIDLLIKLFDPAAIVFTGGLTKAGDYFFEKVKAYTLQHTLEPLSPNIQFLPSSFKEDATLIGAFSLIISKVLQFEADNLNN